MPRTDAFPKGEIPIFSYGHDERPEDLTERELKLTAILYARLGAGKALRETGRLPDEIGGNWNWVPMNVIIRERAGSSLTLTKDEQLVLDAILRERRFPGGVVLLAT